MLKTRIFTTILLSAIVVIAFSAQAIAKDKVKVIDGFKVLKGKLAPRFEAETLDGKTFNLEELRGEKCVIMTFWATFCEPCKKELPYLQKFYEKHKDTCEVIGVSIDKSNHRTVLENKIKELKLTFPMIFDYGDKLRKAIYPARTIPYLVVINRKGEVVSLQIGSVSPAKLPEELEKLLGDDLKPKPKTTETDGTKTETGTTKTESKDEPK